MINVNRELFKIFQDNKDNYILYVKVIEFVEKVIADTKGEENANFYEFTTKLHDSINNAGCEERRSQQIQMLWDINSHISNKYEKYLP